MDIYSYFNSTEIAEHCQKIGKEFSPKEKQILISMSHRPMEERLKGYLALLPEAEGVILTNDFFPKGMCNLSEYILDMLASEQRRIDQFLNGNTATGFYRAKAIEQRERYSLNLKSPEYQSICYRTYTEALNDLIEQYRDRQGDYYHYSIAYEEIGDGLVLIADIDLDGTIFRIQNLLGSFEELDEHTLRRTSDCIDLPIPFVKSDLIEVYDGFKKAGELYVIDRFSFDETKDHVHLLKSIADTDLIFDGYFMKSGNLRHGIGMTGFDTMRSVSDADYMSMGIYCNILMAVKDCMAGMMSLSSFAHVVNYAEYNSVPIAEAFFKLQKLEV